MADEAVSELENASSQAPESNSAAGSATTQAVSSGSSGVEHLEGSESTQTQAQPSFLEQIAEFGDEFKGLTDEAEARNRLLEHARAVRQEREQLQAWQQQAHPYVNYGRQYVGLARDPEFQQFLAAKQARAANPQGYAPQQGQQGPPPPQKWWSPPQYDPAQASKYIQRLVDQSTGEIVSKWRDDTPAEIRANAEAYKNYVENWQDAIATRPHEVIPQIIQQEVAPLIQQVLDERDRQQQSQMFASEVNSRNAEWLYQKDSNGQVLVDPITRQPLFTEPGQKVAQTVRWLDGIGVKDPQARWFLATSLLHREALERSTAAAQTQQTNEQVAAAQKQAALAAGRGANHIPQRNGSRISPEVNGAPRQNKRSSVGREFLNDLKRQGIPPSAIHEAQVG